MQEVITASDAAQAGSRVFHQEIETAEVAAAAVAYSEFFCPSLLRWSHSAAAKALLSDNFLCAWLDHAKMDVHLWGTQDDPRNHLIIP